MGTLVRKKFDEQPGTKNRFSQAEKITTRGDLIPGLIHKLNNHLAPVIGYGQLLLPRTTDAEARRYIEKMIHEVRQASQVIKGFVNFSNDTKMRKGIVDLNDFVKGLLGMEIPRLELKNIMVKHELSSPMPLIQMDAAQMQKVLLNLIDNAEEAISEFHGFGQITVKTRLAGDRLEIIISDDGPGIQMENLSKIFDPFFTTKGKGIGLGLKSALDIVAEHGGEIKAEGEWGKGATFIVSLPITETAERKEKGRERSVENSLRGARGLVIDDDPTLVHFVYKYLENEECKIITAPDAKKALDIIGTEDFDFVICDMRMPEMSGSDFYQIVSQRKPFLINRIIFLTGDVLTDMTREFFESVDNPHLEKPFDLNQLKETILKVINN